MPTFQSYLCTYIHIYIITYCQGLFVDNLLNGLYRRSMEKQRKPFTTSLDVPLLKEIKKLAIDLDKSVNDLLEEAMRDLLKRHSKKGKKED